MQNQTNYHQKCQNITLIVLSFFAFTEDQDDLSWPGMAKYQTSKKHDYNSETLEVPMIRKADLENHNKDGGQWIVGTNDDFTEKFNFE